MPCQRTLSPQRCATSLARWQLQPTAQQPLHSCPPTHTDAPVLPHPPTRPLTHTHSHCPQACEEQMGLEEEALAAAASELGAEELAAGAVKAEVRVGGEGR